MRRSVGLRDGSQHATFEGLLLLDRYQRLDKQAAYCKVILLYSSRRGVVQEGVDVVDGDIEVAPSDSALQRLLEIATQLYDDVQILASRLTILLSHGFSNRIGIPLSVPLKKGLCRFANENIFLFI